MYLWNFEVCKVLIEIFYDLPNILGDWGSHTPCKKSKFMLHLLHLDIYMIFAENVAYNMDGDCKNNKSYQNFW